MGWESGAEVDKKGSGAPVPVDDRRVVRGNEHIFHIYGCFRPVDLDEAFSREWRGSK